MARYVVLAMRDSLDPVDTQMIPDGDLMAPVVLSLVVKMEEALLHAPQDRKYGLPSPRVSNAKNLM